MDKKFLNIKLHDGPGETGGISFAGETLLNFLEETDMSIDSSPEEINKALVECGILPILEFTWVMDEKEYESDEKKVSMLVDLYVGHDNVGNICVDIIIRDYGDEDEKLAYSFDLYIAGEDTGYGYKELKDGSTLPYDYAEGDDIWVADLPTDFEDFKKKAEKLIARYISLYDKKFGGANPYSLVEKASKPVRLGW